MNSKDAVLDAPDYVELVTMPLDGKLPDGVALVGTTLYVDREARGQTRGVNSPCPAVTGSTTSPRSSRRSAPHRSNAHRSGGAIR